MAIKRCLLDSSILSPFLDRREPVAGRIRDVIRLGCRVGTCEPVVAEMMYGFQLSSQPAKNLTRLNIGLKQIACWPLDREASKVYGPVQKLTRPEGLDLLSKEQFDYVIIDEVHHAHAPTYRRVMARLNCTFVLGLTATPERGDGIDVASIFDDNLAYHATIGDGIAEDSLVPFHYVGIRDTVDFEQIPWRNGRFDAAELEWRVERSERMDRLWSALVLVQVNAHFDPVDGGR